MTNNAPTNVYYFVFCLGAERRYGHSDMRSFFEDSTEYTLSTVMHVTKEFEIHDGTRYQITLFDRNFPLTHSDITALYQVRIIDFYDRMYIDYFNDVYGQVFVPNSTEVDAAFLPISSDASMP